MQKQSLRSLWGFINHSACAKLTYLHLLLSVFLHTLVETPNIAYLLRQTCPNGQLFCTFDGHSLHCAQLVDQLPHSFARASFWGSEASRVYLPIRLNKSFYLSFKICRANANPGFLSRPSLFFMRHQTIFFFSSFDLFFQSLKHWKLRWWLANLSEINLMGSACTHLPHGCAFTAVLLIYSWKTALQCPSFKIGKRQSIEAKPTFFCPLPSFLCSFVFL